MNQVTLEGTVDSDGQAIGKMSKVRIATPFERGDGSDYHTVVAFGRNADSVSGLTAGDSVRIEGRLNTTSFDKKDGTKGYETRVVAETVQILSGLSRR